MLILSDIKFDARSLQLSRLIDLKMIEKNVYSVFDDCDIENNTMKSEILSENLFIIY